MHIDANTNPGVEVCALPYVSIWPMEDLLKQVVVFCVHISLLLYASKLFELF